jgi:phage tail sheath protein FI
MTAYLRPGVYVQETLNPVQPVLGADTNTVAAFLGANDRGPITPTLVTSWGQYTTLFGTWNNSSITGNSNSLPLALYTYFANGGSSAYVTRVFNGTISSSTATRAFSDGTSGTPQATLKVSALNPGTWGNNVNVSITASTAGSSTATVTAASATGGVVTYTSNNSFTVGQSVTISGLSTTAFNLSSVIVASASSTQFTVTNAATGTAVTGANASAVAQSNYFDLTVYQNGSTTGNIVEQWVSLSMNPSDPRYAITVISQNSLYIVAADLGSTSTGVTRNPNGGSLSTAPLLNQALAGGSDGSSAAPSSANSSLYSTALSLYDTIRQSLTLNIPAATDVGTINAAIAYATGSSRSNDVFVIIDAYTAQTGQPSLSDSYTAAVSAQLTQAAGYTATSQAAVYYPSLTIADPTVTVSSARNQTVVVGAGAAVAGLYAQTDASRGVFKAPAGLQARIAGAVSVPSLTNANLDALNSASAAVNSIRYISGSGIVVMGARTLKAGYSDQYVPVRRSLMYIEKSLRTLTQFALFEPNDSNLWGRINAEVSAFLRTFWSQGGLSGTTPSAAYFVVCDNTNNTPTTISNGFVNIQVGVALQNPAEFVVINIGQYSGGTTVTVS